MRCLNLKRRIPRLFPHLLDRREELVCEAVLCFTDEGKERRVDTAKGRRIPQSHLSIPRLGHSRQPIHSEPFSWFSVPTQREIAVHHCVVDNQESLLIHF